ncbi:MAG: glutamine--fructose-6-phosphate transaminase (isomerizing) [Haloarculaceae archaeon]
MCGITGCVGREQTTDDLLAGLRNLEYRGYDSAGLAVQNGEGVAVFKRSGEVSNLCESVRGTHLSGAAGIGHTRWSTHGPPTDANAHPHTDCQNQVAVVHNGIIENHHELRTELRDRGHELDSDTDTEVIPHLVAEFLPEAASTEDAFRSAIARLDGSYAIAMLVEGEDVIYAARDGSPLVLGIDDGAHFLASDVPAFLEFTDRVIYLEDGDVAKLTTDEIEITDVEGNSVERSVQTVDWVPEDAKKGEYDHFMHKEIHEQPTALRQAIRGRVDPDTGEVTLEDFPKGSFEGIDAVQFVACGTSYHAGLYAAEVLTERGMRTTVHRASEFVVNPPPADDGTLVVGVTQSGETADTLAALDDAIERGIRTLAVTNVVGSTAARTCDDALFIRAGPEIGVAATKTFSSQIATLLCLTRALVRDTMDGADHDAELFRALHALPNKVEHVLKTSRAQQVAQRYQTSDAHFFIGRHTAQAVAQEAALKLKEISYEHAEGFPAGELKHGPLALVTPETPIFAIATGRNDEKLRSNVEEARARKAPVIAVAAADSPVSSVADDHLTIPSTHPDLAGVLANVQLQLLSYQVASLLNRPIDKPRNLAKSVTVE